MYKRERREKENKAEAPRQFSDKDFAWMKDFDKKGSQGRTKKGRH